MVQSNESAWQDLEKQPLIPRKGKNEICGNVVAIALLICVFLFIGVFSEGVGWSRSKNLGFTFACSQDHSAVLLYRDNVLENVFECVEPKYCLEGFFECM
jgi:hypothetical protein